MSRFLVVISFAVVLGVSVTAGGSAAAAPPCWRPPVTGEVADEYREPSCRWCAGNRGIEYAVAERGEVRAAASGTVTFSGKVAGVTYVVVELANGWRHTYGRLTATDLDAGDTVLVGTSIGAVSSRLFFGLRVGDDYADPAPFIGEVVGRPRLVPIDASQRRAVPAGSVRCVEPSRTPRAAASAVGHLQWRTGRSWR